MGKVFRLTWQLNLLLFCMGSRHCKCTCHATSDHARRSGITPPPYTKYVLIWSYYLYGGGELVQFSTKTRWLPPYLAICMLFLLYMAGVFCTPKYSNTGLFLKLSSLNMNKFKNRWSGHIELLKMYWMYNILNTPERGYTVWVFYNSNAFLYLASSCWSSATASRQEMRQERGDIR